MLLTSAVFELHLFVLASEFAFLSTKHILFLLSILKKFKKKNGPNWSSFTASLGFHCGSAGKESICNARDLGSIPGLRRSRSERKGYPLQYSCLENSMSCIVHGVTKSQTRLSDFHFHFTFTRFINLNSLNSLNWNRMFEIDVFILDSHASIGSWVCSPSQSSC